MLRLLELHATRDERKERVRALQIENARSMVALEKELGYREKQIKNMVRWVDARQQRLLEFAGEEKLSRISVVPEGTGR